MSPSPPPSRRRKPGAARARASPGGRRRGWRSLITPELAEFLARARSFYFATASAEGQPYIQHRGGPEGFLRVLDAKTLGFADYAGNRQYITTGNLSENPRAMLFVMHYRARRP